MVDTCMHRWIASAACLVCVLGCKPTDEPPEQGLPLERSGYRPCAFEVSTPATLEEALVDGLPSLPGKPLTFELTWLDAADEWLESKPAGATEGTLTLELATVTGLRVATPGKTQDPVCQRHVELELDAHLQTADGAIDSPARVELTIWSERIDGELRLMSGPKLALVGAELVGRVELEGQATRVRLDGHGTPGAAIGHTLLASTAVAPLSTAAPPGSLTEAALRHAQD